jgi:hypothetical protein
MPPLRGFKVEEARLTRRAAPGYYISPLRGFSNSFSTNYDLILILLKVDATANRLTKEHAAANASPNIT